MFEYLRQSMNSRTIEDLKTPSLILDVDRVRSNAARITSIVDRHNVRLRPHIKTHKCVEIARIQTAGHNGAVTVSTLAEARAFAANGFRDITYAVPIEPGKFDEAASLVEEGVDLKVITDDPSTPAGLNEIARRRGISIGVFLEVDCGDHRSGVKRNIRVAMCNAA